MQCFLQYPGFPVGSVLPWSERIAGWLVSSTFHTSTIDSLNGGSECVQTAANCL